MRIAKFQAGEKLAWGLIDGPEIVVFRGHPLFQGYETTGERFALKFCYRQSCQLARSSASVKIMQIMQPKWAVKLLKNH